MREPESLAGPVGLRLLHHQGRTRPLFRPAGSSWYEWYSLAQHFELAVSTELAVGDDEALRAVALTLLPGIDRWEHGRFFGLPRISVSDESEWVAVDKDGRPLSVTYEQLQAFGVGRVVLA